MRAAAFFDLDKTLIARSTALAFAGPLYQARLLSRRDLTRSAYAQLNFVSHRADHALMERLRTQVSTTITGWEVEGLRAVIARHLESVLTPLLYAEAVDLVRVHRDAGRAVILVTTTGNDMADPIGALLGVDRVLSTRMVVRDGRFTGEISDYMYGDRKATAIADLATREEYDLSASYAYSDSVTDVPMLEIVGHPYAVNPDHALRQIARDRGWPILDFSDAPVRRRRPRTRRMIMIGSAIAISVVALIVAVRSRRLGSAGRAASN